MKLKGLGRTFALLAVLAWGWAGTAWAQNSNSGEIKGIVTDPSSAVIPNAGVTIVNTQTGVVTKTVTNNVGLYDVPSLPIGRYTITFSKEGFRTEVRENVELEVATVGVNVTLQVGKAAEQIVVTTDVPLLQTEDSSQHVEFDTHTIEDAPIVGGVWYNELTNVLPGLNGSGQGVGVNGTEGYMGTFLMDGGLAQMPHDSNASDNFPPLDAIAEVDVQTSNSGAQYGTGTATFNVTIKSGTNNFHGSLFEKIENDAFNAHNYFDPAGSKKAPIRWNMFGGSVGGPIRKDKLFFFFTFQDNPQTNSGYYYTTVPTTGNAIGNTATTNMTAGCFPLSPAQEWVNPTYVNSSNCLTGNLDPVALAIQKYFPAPNIANAPGGGTAYLRNYVDVVSTPTSAKIYVGKIDYTLTPKHRLSATYEYYPIKLTYNVDALCSFGFDCTPSNGNGNQDGQITETWTISPKMVNEARVSGVRELDKYTPATYGKGYPTKLGMEPAYGTNSPTDIFPNITISADAPISNMYIGGGAYALLADGSYTGSDILTLIHGKHTIKLGGEYDKSYVNQTGWGDQSSGNFTFNGEASWSPYADFLLGDVYGWYVYQSPETGALSSNGSVFVQDDFKLRHNLTINAGFRYLRQSGWTERHNLWGSFDPTLVNSGQYANNALGAVTYGGQNGRTAIQNGGNQYVPRVGFSWQPSPDWTVRASYGISTAAWSQDPYSAGLGLGLDILNPSGTSGYGNYTVFQLQSGPPKGTVVYQTLANVSNAAYNYTHVPYYPRTRPSTYYQQMLFSVQHQFAFRTMVDVSYVHTKGTHLPFLRDSNQIPTSEMTPTSTEWTPTRAYPLFTTIVANLFDGYSNYNALQVHLEKKVSFGLSASVNYSYSKLLDTGEASGNNSYVDTYQDAFNLRANYGGSPLDTRNMLNGSVTYQLPFGRGQHFALKGPLDEAFGGWMVSSIFNVHSGNPMTVTMPINTSAPAALIPYTDQDQAGVDPTWTCSYALRPNVSGSVKASNRSIHEWFNINAFTKGPAGTFGNESRGTLTSPGWADMDMQLAKSFVLYREVSFRLEARATDVLNHPNFDWPDTSMGDYGTYFGTITGAAAGRFMELGGHISF